MAGTRKRQQGTAPVGLQGIKVIEAAAVFAGPMAGRLLADWGADVIHIEHPVRGDISRSQAAGRLGGRIIPSDINYISENYNRNKRGLLAGVYAGPPRLERHQLLQGAPRHVPYQGVSGPPWLPR